VAGAAPTRDGAAAHVHGAGATCQIASKRNTAAMTQLNVTSKQGARADLILTEPPSAHTWLYWCPAMGVTARQYRVFAEAMAAAGIGVATHEWRGAGSSDQRASRRNDWGYRDLLDDIDAGVARLRSARTVGRLLIGGHSLGAQLAALALAREPALAEAYVLIASGMPWWRSFPRWQQPILFGVFGGFRLLSALCGWFPGRRVGFAGDEARGVVDDWARSGSSGRYRVAGLELDFDAALARVNVPAWAAHLEHDRFAPLSSTTELQSRLPLARWQTEHYTAAQFAAKQATHFSWMKEPGPIVARLREWIG